MLLNRTLVRRPSRRVCLQLIGQADSHGTIALYGDQVLPALRSTS